MGATEGLLYRSDRAILAKMHAKEKVTAPITTRFLQLRLEVVVGLELVGHHPTPDTNFAHVTVTSCARELDFAERAGFPDHGAIAMGYRDGEAAHDLALIKDAATWNDLTSALHQCIAKAGAAFVEKDMCAPQSQTEVRDQTRGNRPRTLFRKPMPWLRSTQVCGDRATFRPAVFVVRRADAARRGRRAVMPRTWLAGRARGRGCSGQPRALGGV